MGDSRARVARGARVALSVTLGLATLSACGGGSAALVSAERRFEHCYRLDEDPSTEERERLDCWRAWSARDAARDSLDEARARYARERLRPREPAPTATTAVPARAER